MIVYVAVHKVDGTIYFGWSSKTLEQRRNDHIYNAIVRKSRCYFHNALRKHGVDAFEWWVIEHHSTDEEAKQSEAGWIHYARSRGLSLYNTTDGADYHNGFLGKKHTCETRAQMTSTRRGRKLKTVYHGEEAANSKLTQAQVDEIRASQLPHRELSKMYGVVPSQICHIKKGKHWK